LAGPSIREAGPRGNAAAEASDVVDSVPAILVLLVLGLALRLIIAYVLLPGSGFPSDLASFQGWSGQLAAQTPLGFYDKAGFLDYPPVYLLFLWVLGLLVTPFGGVGETVKLIPIFGDLALAYLVFTMAHEMGASRRRAVLAAAVVLLNPITWFNSAIWGQADVIGSIFLLLGLRALLQDRRELAAALAVVAALTKIQLGILGILVGFVVLRRSLAPRDGESDPRRVLTSIGAGLATAALVCLPFTGLDFVGLAGRLNGSFVLTVAAGLVAAAGIFLWIRRWEWLSAANRQLVAGAAAGMLFIASIGMVFDSIAVHIASTFGEYPWLTLNAYNPWALLAEGPGNAMDQNLGWIHDASVMDKGLAQPFFSVGPFNSGVTLALIGLGLLLVAMAVLATLLARSVDREDEEAGSEDDEAPETEALAPELARSALEPPKPVVSVSSELRSTAVGLLLVVGALLFVLAGPAAVSLLGAPFGVSLSSLPAAVFGDACLLAILVGVGIWTAWRDDGLSIAVALAILAIAFFVVPTRVHERYLFPFFAIGAVLLAVSWRWSVAYVVLAAVNAANLLAVLIEYKGIPGVQGADGTAGPVSGLIGDWGHFLLSAQWPAGVIWPIALSGIVTALALLWALAQMRSRAVEVLAWEAESAGREPEPTVWSRVRRVVRDDGAGRMYAAAEPPIGGDQAVSQAAALGDAGADADAELAPGEPYGIDRYEGEEGPSGPPPEFVPAWVMKIWRLLSRPSLRPDRSAALVSEPRGRLDRMDLWLVALLAVTVLSMRIYRLDEPASMHFDEVYHARTATEFLQDWRYGIPHSIYEWTHPDLAKYAIAGGLVLFSDDKVTATGNLTVPVKDAVVQPRIVPGTTTSSDTTTTDPRTNPDARLGDRLYVATGTAVNAYDLETRTQVASYAIPGASSLSMAADTGYMYVGTSDGRIWRINVYSLDDVRLGAIDSPEPPTQMTAQVGFPIAHLYAGSPPMVLAVDAAGNIVSMDGTGAIIGRGKVDGAVDFAQLGTAPASLTYKPSASASSTLPAEARALSTAVGISEADAEEVLSQVLPGVSGRLNLGSLTADQISSVQKLIDAGQLPGIEVAANDPQVIVAYSDGLGVMDERNLVLTSTIPTATVVRLPTANSSPAPDVPAEAQAIAVALGKEQASVEAALTQAAGSSSEQPIVLGSLSQDQLSALQQLIDDGSLPDIAIRSRPATSIAINPNTSQSSYVAAGNSILLIKVNQSGTGSVSSTTDSDQTLLQMPGPVTKVVFDNSSKVAEALGRTPDGSGWTVYAIESNGNAVFSDARLPWEPIAIGADVTPDMPQTDHHQLLAISPDGSMAAVDIGQFAFAWRIVGVFFGALMAVCLYLLARLLFRRRSIGLLVALFSCIDGMAFVQSRIAMNDTYVGGFLLLAYLLFAYLWLGDKSKRRSWLAFWIGMPMLGILLGLALASKWVALYAIASIGILILIRSALGRLVTILAMAAGTGVLGWTAINEMHTMPGTGDLGSLGVLAGVGFGVLAGGIYLASVRARTTPDRVLFLLIAAAIAAPIFVLAMTYYPAADQNGSPNYTFFLILFTATAIAAAANVYHPVAWSREELRFAIAVPLVIGIGAGVYGVMRGNPILMAIGGAGIVVPAAAFWIAGQFGFGPLAAPPSPDDPSYYADPPTPAAEGWLRLGSGYGLPAVWAAACVLILPIVVYVGLYIPWAAPWQPQTAATAQAYKNSLPVLVCAHPAPDIYRVEICPNGDGWPAGHTGQTLFGLTQAMYNYHNDLRQPHAAASPWWAWPLDLKPVWFESIGYAGDTGSMIYDGGNPILWWLALTGMAFACWQAFKRRSLGLALIAIAFSWQWLSWTRIDRASFQYHFYTALPFYLLALAYFLAEVWHGASRRTWFLARAGVAGMLLLCPFLWLVKYPLCSLARVDQTDTWGQIVCGPTTGDFRVEQRVFLIAVVLVLALVVLAVTLVRLERRSPEETDRDRSWILQLLAPVVVAGAMLLWLGANASHDLLFEVPVPADAIVLMLLPLFGILAIVALSAREPRRFVLGVCASAVIAFVVLYPNLSALPMPNNIVSAYNGFIPTWLYGFQFAVDQQQGVPVKLISTETVTLSIAVLATVMLVGYAVWVRRVVIGYRRHQLLLEDGGEPGEHGEHGDRPGDAPGGTAVADEPTSGREGPPA
jgi:hypothetical protein